MENLHKYIDLVKENLSFNERSAKKFRSDDQRFQSYSQRAVAFRELLQFLEELPTKFTPKAPQKQSSIYLSPTEIQDLPADLLKELSISESERKEFTVIDIINKLGGVASIDKILIEIYRQTNEIEQRSRLIGRLYRMVNKQMIFPGHGKGVYSTTPLNEEKGGKGND